MEGVDLSELFLPTVPLLETFLRGTGVYLALFAMLRFFLKREAAQIGVTDLLVVVLLADATQNAMAPDYQSITDGLLLVAVIIGWSYALDLLSFRFPLMNRLIKPGKLLLVRNGVALRRNMERELITDDELATALRQRGIADIREVSQAWMESDGSITAISRKPRKPG